MKKRFSALITFVVILGLFSSLVYAAEPEAAGAGDPGQGTVIETQEEAPEETVQEPAQEQPETVPEEDETDGTEEVISGSEAPAAETPDVTEEPAAEETPEELPEEAVDAEEEEQVLLGAGESFSPEGDVLSYKVLDETKKTAAVTGGESGLTSVTIPAEVTYGGVTYKVTEIAAKAFADCGTITAITFEPGSNLKVIRENAFSYNLEAVPAVIDTLTFPASLETVETGAFRCIPVRHFAVEANSMLEALPDGFLAADGDDGEPGKNTETKFIWDYIVEWFVELTDPVSTPEAVAKACDCLESIDLGEDNSIARIGMGAFKNQTHLTSINFGTAACDLTIARGAFTGVGNGGAGIDTLTFPAHLAVIESRAFDFAKVKNLVFSSYCRLAEIPDGFMEISQEGNNGRPGEANIDGKPVFVNDPAQIGANSLVTIRFGADNSLGRIGKGAFKNQSHLTEIDFGTSSTPLTIADGAFIGAGNNGYLYAQGVDSKLNPGIQTLTLPANLISLGEEYEYSYTYGGHTYSGKGKGAGVFDEAKIINLVFADNCQLEEIPSHFLGMSNAGYNGYPGKYYADGKPAFANDQEQLQANSLATISFGANNSLKTIGSGAFYNQSHLTKISFGTSEVPELRIGSGAFIGAGNNGYLFEQKADKALNAGIDTLVLPANLRYLDSGCFEYAKIKNLVFSDGSGVETIPSGFMGVHGPGSNGYPGMQTKTDGDGHIVKDKFGQYVHEFIKDQAQIQANSLESIRFGQGNHLKSIDSGTFYNQSHLKTIDFGTAAEGISLQIYSGAFIGAGNNGCLVENKVDTALNEGIATLTLPANLTSIGLGAFEYARVRNLVLCDNSVLTEIPSNFLGINGVGNNGHPGQDPDGHFVKDQAQLAANSLESISFGQNNRIRAINSAAFRNQSHVTKIDFGTSNAAGLSIYGAAFDGVGNNKYLVQSKAETSLGAGIATLTLPANLSYMDSSAFSDSGVKNIVFSNGITFTSLSSGVFQDLDLMTKLVLDGTFPVTELDGGVFSKCDELTTIDMRGSSITKIDDSLKQNPKLKYVYFPETLEAVLWTNTEKEGECPFYECGKVNSLQFAAVDPAGYTFTDDVFKYLNKAGVVYVPEGTTDEAVDAYVNKLTAAGLVFGPKNWKIERGEMHIPATEFKGTLLAKMTAKGQKALTISWTKVTGAEGYDVFFGTCSTSKDKTPTKIAKTVTGNKTLTWTKKSLKKSAGHIAYVRAWVMDGGQKVYVATSPRVHAFVSGSTKNYTNPSGVTVNKTKVTLKKGKTFKLKATVKKLVSSKKLMPKTHDPILRYVTSDKTVATVSTAGKITAKKKGTCKIYVITQNGIYKTVSVTVK